MSLVLLLLSLSLLLYILERSLLIFEHIRIFDIYVILLYSTFFKLIKEYSHKTKRIYFHSSLPPIDEHYTSYP